MALMANDFFQMKIKAQKYFGEKAISNLTGFGKCLLKNSGALWCTGGQRYSTNVNISTIKGPQAVANWFNLRSNNVTRLFWMC